MISGAFQLAFIGPGGPEILVVMLALLLMFGAKDAPRVFRKLNDILNQIRSTAESFKREVMYGDLTPEPHAENDIGEYEDYGLGVDEDSDETGHDAPVDAEEEGGDDKPV